MNTPEIVYSETFNPEDEALRLKSMSAHVRHEHMLESHRQAKATRRENHKRGYHRMRCQLACLK